MGQQQRTTRRFVALAPVFPFMLSTVAIVLSIVSVIATGIWYHFSRLALADTKVIAALISIPVPSAFSKYLPALLIASLVLVIVQCVMLLATYTWRMLQLSRGSMLSTSITQPALQRRSSLAAFSGVVAVLQYIVTLWFVFMVAISMLWLGGGMVAAKATSDGASTMSVVDETMPRLIQNAMGIDPRKSGYLVHVAGRDVNIGTSTCSLFCFTLARAMLADTIDCTCNEKLAGQLMPAGNVTAYIPDTYTCSAAPVMCSINGLAIRLYRRHMLPAVISIIITIVCLLGLLHLIGMTHASVMSEMISGTPISRTSSTDADMRISNGSDGDAPAKTADAKVVSMV